MGKTRGGLTLEHVIYGKVLYKGDARARNIRYCTRGMLEHAISRY